MNFEPHLFLSFSLMPMLGLEMDKDLCKSLAQKWSIKFLLDTSPREEIEGEGLLITIAIGAAKNPTQGT